MTDSRYLSSGIPSLLRRRSRLAGSSMLAAALMILMAIDVRLAAGQPMDPQPARAVTGTSLRCRSYAAHKGAKDRKSLPRRVYTLTGANLRFGSYAAHKGAKDRKSLPRRVYHSAFQLAFSPNGQQLAVTDYTAGQLVLLDSGTGTIQRRTDIGGHPAGVAWSPDGQFVFVANAMGNQVISIRRSDGEVTSMEAEWKPVGIATVPPPATLPGELSLGHACSVPRVSEAALARWKRAPGVVTVNSTSASIAILDPSGGVSRQVVPAGREPYDVAVTPDGRLAVVANRLPDGDASDPLLSATVTLVDLKSARAVAAIPLPPNSTNVDGVCISPDGRWAYAVHNLARAQLPTEQIEYGWINANALTIINLTERRHEATVLLDHFNDAAANPFDVAVSPDGATLWVTLSGVHQLGRIDLQRLHAELPQFPGRIRSRAGGRAEQTDGLSTARGSMEYSSTWQLGFEDPMSVEVVISDLPAEYGQGQYVGKILRRLDLPGQGPRGVAVTPDGRQVAVALYFSGSVVLVDTSSFTVHQTVLLGDQPALTDARRGEMIFHDANYCFQRWLSCSTCHPDGRADGLNWDLMNDGIGNPKNTRSLVWSDRTPPSMWRGVRPNMRAAAAAGFEHLLARKPQPDELQAVEAYLSLLAPEPGPRLVDGRFSEKAERGRAVFEDPQVGCARCHSAPWHTDLQLHNVGTRAEADESSRFDTPALVELWRTAPYLHHGQAATLRSLLTTMNPTDRHGRTSHLTDEQLDALIEYLESL